MAIYQGVLPPVNLLPVGGTRDYIKPIATVPYPEPFTGLREARIFIGSKLNEGDSMTQVTTVKTPRETPLEVSWKRAIKS